MANRMYEYWKSQPDVLKRILDTRKEQVQPFVELFCACQPDRLYLVGSGTSLNAQRAAAPYLEQILNVDVRTAASSRVGALRGQRPLVVFLSQGGSSTNTLSAMERLQKVQSICITGEEHCEIQRRAAHHMTIGCGEEQAGPKTVGYTSSVMCLYLCALEAALAAGRISRPFYQEQIALLYTAVENMRENLVRTGQWFERNRQDLVRIQKYVLVGIGGDSAAAREGCLKILETIKVPAMSFEFEEYLHGPIILTDSCLGGIFYIGGDAQERARMVELARCHAEFSQYAYPVVDSGSEPELQDPRMLELVRTGQDHTRVFEAVLAPQLLAAEVPGILGIDEGSPTYDRYTSCCPTKYNNGR